MLLRSRTGLVFFGVPTPIDQGGTVTGEDRPVGAAPAPPGEADSPQLLAAEQLGMFSYPHASYRHPMLGHTA